jgi:hypothetical protein
MKRLNLLCGVTLALALAACGGDDKKPEDPGTAIPTPTVTPTPTPTPTPAPTPSPTAVAPEPVPTLAPTNKCREIETTDWTARVQGGALKVSAKAHLKSGGWKLTIADRGLTKDLPGKQLLELVAEKPSGPATLPVGIRPIEFSKPAPASINRVEARCGPNRIVLIRL